ncbi:hypothetical protein A2W14_03215 [Candidatus Gottesmanbacteria bacterium RBG_16_37_8]|uniref:EamA domain-containing protein n=1 Tax=Candidatus Gottesmanbacteria bacterium RBG_16_37_8 TaxID=1798371 RepID=A0A1F5YTY8_9BACT|nr:MAG: hypothetical protein A2W14_03215 [Candidatus Gottesmanbacteria bacterium RBG_16_37_8]
MKVNKKIKKGILFALLTAFISGVSIFYNKLVIVKGIDPLSFNIIKNGGVAVILSVVILRTLFTGKKKIIQKQEWSKLILIGIVGGSLPFILFFTGLKDVAAANANLIHKLLFIFVALMAIPFLKEKLHPLQIIGYLFIVYACFFIGGFAPFSFSIYEGMILLATMLWGVENIIAKVALRKTNSSLVAWGRMFFGTIVLIFTAILTGKIHFLFNLQANQVLPILGSIALLTLYVSSWYKALSLAPATLVTSILVLATPITNILSAAFITHNFGLTLTFNTTTILLGILLINFGWLWRKKIAV